MGWYRTHSGRLIYGQGGLADVYERRGWKPVDDDTAQAEVESGEAQTRADVEGELAAEVDARADKQGEKGEKPSTARPVPILDDTALLVVDHDQREMTEDQKALVERAIDEES